MEVEVQNKKKNWQIFTSFTTNSLICHSNILFLSQGKIMHTRSTSFVSIDSEKKEKPQVKVNLATSTYS